MEKNMNIQNINSPKVGIGSQLKPLVLPIITAIGAFGGFPQPPRVFGKLIKYEPIQYLLLFCLIWQGGAEQNWKLALKVTLVIYIIVTLGHIYDARTQNRE
tara:strand:+ start:1250 stop:1552 length:303 start_codon:yes stop_codon:yes gene_type:complete